MATVSRLTDLLTRYANHHQPIDLRLLESIIRTEKLTGSLLIHYRNGEPRLLEAGKPIQVEVEPIVIAHDTASLTFPSV